MGQQAETVARFLQARTSPSTSSVHMNTYDGQISVEIALADVAPLLGLEDDDELLAAARLLDASNAALPAMQDIRSHVDDRVVQLVQDACDEAARVTVDDSRAMLLRSCRCIRDLLAQPSADQRRMQRAVDEARLLLFPALEQGVGLCQRVLTALMSEALFLAHRLVPTATPALPGRGDAFTGLYAIVSPETPRRNGDIDFLAFVEQLLEGGASVIQLRMKNATTREILSVAEAIGPLCDARDVPFIVNDRIDLALAAQSSGVHLGQNDMPARVARAILGQEARIGVSTHTHADVDAAVLDGHACHLGFGPVFPSPTKQGHAHVTGSDVLGTVCASTALPVVAIGGIISPGHVAQVARAGARLAAVISGLADAHSPRTMAQRMSLSFAAARAAAEGQP